MKILSEKFIDYFKTGSVMGIPASTFILFENPTSKEWQSVKHGARGWIRGNGDLWIEGSDEEEYSNTIHKAFLDAIEKKRPDLMKDTPSEFSAKFWSKFFTPQRIEKYGILIQRDRDSTGEGKIINLSESYDWMQIDDSNDLQDAIATMFDRCKKKNSYLNFSI